MAAWLSVAYLFGSKSVMSYVEGLGVEAAVKVGFVNYSSLVRTCNESSLPPQGLQWVPVSGKTASGIRQKIR